MSDPVCDNHELMQQFWPKQMSKINSFSVEDYREINRHQELPIARIKKIMKIDEVVKTQMISSEAPVMLAKACEMIIEELTTRAWIHTQANRRKTIQKSDVVTAINRCEMFDFLIDIVPREEASKPQDDNGENDADGEDEINSQQNRAQNYQSGDGPGEIKFGDGQVLQATQIGPSIPISGHIGSPGIRNTPVQMIQLPTGEFQLIPIGAEELTLEPKQL